MYIKVFQEGTNSSDTAVTINVTPSLAGVLKRDNVVLDDIIRLSVSDYLNLIYLTKFTPVITFHMYRNATVVARALRELVIIQSIEKGDEYITDRNIPDEIKDCYKEDPRKGKDNRLH